MLIDVDVDELQHALGGVVLEAAYLERVLRAAFSALVGSKYAVVVDGRLTAASLIEDCEQLTRYHTGISQPVKDVLLAALRACHDANRERNRVIHDTWATRPGSAVVTLAGEPEISRRDGQRADVDRGAPASRSGGRRSRRIESRHDHRSRLQLGSR